MEHLVLEFFTRIFYSFTVFADSSLSFLISAKVFQQLSSEKSQLVNSHLSYYSPSPVIQREAAYCNPLQMRYASEGKYLQS